MAREETEIEQLEVQALPPDTARETWPAMPQRLRQLLQHLLLLHEQRALTRARGALAEPDGCVARMADWLPWLLHAGDFRRQVPNEHVQLLSLMQMNRLLCLCALESMAAVDVGALLLAFQDADNTRRKAAENVWFGMLERDPQAVSGDGRVEPSGEAIVVICERSTLLQAKNSTRVCYYPSIACSVWVCFSPSWPQMLRRATGRWLSCFSAKISKWVGV